MDLQITPQLQLALDFVETTGKNIFLTGKAGTGKTTFLHNLKRQTSKRMVVVAPTGVAAINAGGVTIHSFFQLSFGPQLPYSAAGIESRDSSRIQRFSRVKINIIKSLDLLVIDEVSMVRADLLDGIDSVLRRFKNRNKPFGGVQLLMIGDLQQLAPIAKDDEWAILREHYDTVFFFSSKALQQTSFVSIELKDIFRQSDQQFIDLLNKVRNNELNLDDVNMLNQRYMPNFKPNDTEGYITLTTHNNQAHSINTAKLKELKAEPKSFTATVKGDFPEHAYPTDYELTLKVGAQVMFVKNDPTYEKLFFNGKIGTVEDIDEEGIYVQCPNDPAPILVTPLEWENTNYTIDPDTKQIKENITGKFVQYPLKLAWAITIHKSQGLTFDRAIVDAQAAFAHGQVYVALSRCRSLDGLVLSSQVNTNAIISDKAVTGFTKDVENNQPSPSQLVNAQIEYQRELVLDLFDFTQIQKNIDYTLRLIRENAGSFPPQLSENLTRQANRFKSEIFDVAAKFCQQVGKLVAEHQSVQENVALQERIKKAVAYFTPKIEEDFLQVFLNTNYESDSVDLESKAKDQLERIVKNLGEKMVCIKACEDGFNLLKFLDVRAKAAIEDFKKKKARTKGKEVSVDTIHPELFERLRQWRQAVASERKDKVFKILRQNTLYDIVNQLPYHKAQLKAIKGLGPKKIASFGNDILDIVREYRVEKGLGIPEGEVFETDDDKSNKPKSWEISFELFQQGKAIAQIAKERDMVESTIANHLTRYIDSGEIPIDALVNPEKIEAISQYFLNADDTRLAPAKEALGDEYSYNELRWVLKHLISAGKIKTEDNN
ncbi:MAG: helix-turn-helix domain-containing protein [Tenuifilaceae bacterium]|nr:helix-turn-helix domain-containing protein [Tenuifilaceae bacterium]